jgi:DNA-binding MarR family transcriptional regulator
MVLRLDPDGKRYRALLQLSEKGREIANRVNDMVLLAVAKASEGYDKEKQQIFARVLGLVAGNLQDICRDGLESQE